MRLVSKASQSQIETGIQFVGKLGPNRVAHEIGLRALADWKELSSDEIIEFLDDPHDLTQKYGAIVAKRRINHSPELIQHAAQSENEVVSRFAKEWVE